MTYKILYRGPLSSCNYACVYCPFAKTKNTREELLDDAEKLSRFTNWVGEQSHDVELLFTPWGEAMIRRHYQDAFKVLSHFKNVKKVCAQTNLSGSLDWVDDVEKASIALWCTFHPSQTTQEKFLAQTEILLSKGISFSVGTVGLKEDFAAISSLRNQLSKEVYLWVNAYKRVERYYSPEDVDYLVGIDPLFKTNNVRYKSLGESCRAGMTSFSVDGDGRVQRCHFIKDEIGNIYEDDFFDKLVERSCTNATCGCYIGYIHLDKLKQYEVYGERMMERIPISTSSKK